MATSGIKTPAELAKKLRIHRQTVHKWVDGQSDKLTPEYLFALADALQVNPRWLAFGPPESPVQPQTLDPEQAEVVQIKTTLEHASPEAKDQWLTSGRSLVKIVAPKSTANPFTTKVK